MTHRYMAGAAPFELLSPHAQAGIILLHGFSGSVSEVRTLGERLHAEGFSVVAPALAGHGTSTQDLARVQSPDFFAIADAAYADAASRFKRVYLIGLSLGGALALSIAARHRVAAVVTISTPLFMSRLVGWSIPFISRWMPRRNVVSNLAAWRGEVVGYRTTPISSLLIFLEVLEGVREQLPRVSAPLLVLHSTGDKTVPLANARFIASQVASADKEVIIYKGGRHILTLPPTLAKVEADITRFLRAQEAPYVTDFAAHSKGATL